MRQFLSVLVREKELVYRYVITGNKLIKDLQARLLPLVFNAGEIARGYEQLVAHHLAGNSFLAVRAAFSVFPKAKKSYFSIGRFISIIYPIKFYCSPFLLKMFTHPLLRILIYE